MSAETIIRCDGTGCKEIKREGNHWLVGVCRIDAQGNLSVELAPMDGRTASSMDKTFCGVPCAVRKIQELLEEMMKR